MNLRNIRKSREYQCLLIDLVKVNVIGKSAAEGLLGYTIPAGLLGNTTPATPVDDDEEEETGNTTPATPVDDDEEEETGNTVTLLYLDDSGTKEEWKTAKYDLTENPTGEGIIDFAKDQFGDDTINNIDVVEEDPEYVEGESGIGNKYTSLDPQPETLEPGMFIIVLYKGDNQR